MAPPASNQEARRAAVAAALEAGGTLSAARCRQLARQFGCHHRTIYRDMERLDPSHATAGSPPAVLGLATGGDDHDRDVAILRVLGRLEFATTTMLQALVLPDRSNQAVLQRLKRLHTERRIWCEETSMAQVQPAQAGGRPVPPPKSPFLWGLTPEGLGLLRALGGEPDEETYKTLRTRPHKEPDVARAQLKHDLQVARWCASVIDGARRSKLLEAVRCTVEYVSARTPDGRERQRFDALLVLRFRRTPPAAARGVWEIPWDDGDASADRVTLTYALEVDWGTEPLKILLAKALEYRTHTESGHFRRTLKTDVLPVFLVPTAKRAAQIAQEYQTAWPGGRGVISTFVKAAHPQHGALWGEYLTLTDTPAQKTHLLRGVFPELRTWEQQLLPAWTTQMARAGGTGR